MTKAFVLCAGEGIRLRPLTLFRPKPLLPLGARPALFKVLHGLRTAGVQDVVANMCHLKKAFHEIMPVSPLGMTMRYSEENQLLDTGGGLARAWPLLNPEGPFFLHNGDILFEGDLQACMACHQEQRNLVTLLTSSRGGPSTVGIAKEGRVLGFRDPTIGDEQVSWCGIAVVSPGLRSFFPALERFSILDAFRAAIHAGERVVSHDVGEAYWADFGTFTGYLKAHEDAAAGRLSLPASPWVRNPCPSEWVRRDAVVDPGSEIRGFVAVGRRSRVLGGAKLKDTVIWDGCHVDPDAELTSCVVVDGGRATGRHEGEVIAP